MGLPYHFVSLDDAQTAHRRHLLDSYGQFAQLSALVPLVVFGWFFTLRSALMQLQESRTRSARKERQSPQVSSFPKRSDTVSSGNLWGRFDWALGDQVIDGWGTRREWIFAGLWTAWLLVLVFKDTGDGMFDFDIWIRF